MSAHRWNHRLAGTGLILLGVAAHILPATAAPVTFTIDPAQSSISLSGTVTLPLAGTYAFQPQAPGSLTTSYHGRILAELTPPTIRFLGGSLIEANSNGTWQPAVGGAAGSAPANYGGLLTPPLTTGYSAGRNLRVDLTSPAALLTNGCFDAGLLAVTYLTNSTPLPSMDFRVTSFIPGQSTNGTTLLSGSATNSPGVGFLTNGAAGMLTLVLPVNTTNVSADGANQMTTVLHGQIVATAPASAWPLAVDLSLQSKQLTLSWPSLPGQHFTVQTTQDLGTPWQPASGTIGATGNTTTWTADAVGLIRFYRVIGPF